MTAGRWSSLNILVQKVLSFGSLVVLARLIQPSDFGIVTLATLVPGVLYTLTSPNFGAAFIQSSRDLSSYLNVMWTFRILRALIIALLVWFIGEWLASFFHISGAVWIVRLSSFAIVFQAFSNIGDLYFVKDIDFRKHFVRDIVIKSIYTTVAISGGFIFRSYLAIFLAMIALELSGFIMTYILSPYRPHFDFNFSRLKDLLPQAKWFYSQDLLGLVYSNTDNILIGRFAGAGAVGLWGKANALATIPSPIGSMINKIGFPALAKIQEDRTKVTEGVMRMFDIMLLATLPVAATILIAGNRLILLLLGPDWLAMVPILKVLTIGMTINMVFFTINEPALNSIGQARVQSYLQALYCIMFVTLLLVLVPKFGAIGAAWAILVASSVIGIETMRLLRKFISLNAKRVLATALIITLITILLALIGLLLLEIPIFNHDLGFIILAGCLGITYFLLTITFGHVFGLRGPAQTIKLILLSSLPRSVARKLSGILPPARTS